jgi:hypothetical protein
LTSLEAEKIRAEAEARVREAEERHLQAEARLRREFEGAEAERTTPIKENADHI